ncbi:hypothetical protein [Ornithinimicrobium cavernae]|uniref:hypothetical protein n=1 Tax=Ornithinimicrobium cavernae TaxID=2666047 RepID=UPI000D68C38C|nr:hypothetical protein [Ornithinimicrobium cavernae]
MTALATRPEDLRLAARTLHGAAAELEEVAARLGRSGATASGGWQGVAALGHQVATERVRAVVLGRCAPAHDAAGSLAVLADQAEHAVAAVRSAQRARDEATAERIRQITLLGTVTDPLEIAAIRERIMCSDRVIRRAEDEIAWVEERLEQGRRAAEEVLRSSWLGIGLGELGDLVRAGQEIAPVWRGGSLLVVGTRVLLATAGLARELSPVARLALEARLLRLLRVVRKPPIIFVLSRLAFRVVIPLTVIPAAWSDLRDGGGYEGWRGVTLRVTAALAIPGSVAMVVPHPVVAGLGAVTVGAYYLAKGGFAIYDHRLLLAQIAQRVLARRHDIIRTARKVLQPSPALPLGPLGSLGPMVPRAKELLSDLPDLDELARYLPAIGGPIAVPDVPIGTGARLPAVPPPALGVIGSGILLPSLRRLF